MSVNPLYYVRIWGFCWLMIFLVVTGRAEVIYKSIDEDGQPVFSDRERGAREQINISPVNSVEVLKVDSIKKLEPPNGEKTAYKIAIKYPRQDHTYRNNEVVKVTIASEPKVRKSSGHRIVALLDGSVFKKGQTSGSFTIPALDRGSHQLIGLVVDASGKEIARSEATTFFVQKVSLINKARLKN